MGDKSGRVVFIGNIPYGLSEEQIVHTFSSVGQVLNFRLVYDNDTGRPKGFGFAEFADTDSAASAVRNLNNHEIMGRELRVDFSHVGGKDDAAPAGYNAQQQQPQTQSQQPLNGYQPPAPSALPPLPPGVELPPNVSCPDAISKTLAALPQPQLLDILSQMKGLVMGDPPRAMELLKQAPQMSYAIFQALLLLNLVDTSVLGSVVEQAQHSTQPTPQPVPPRPAPVYQPPPQQQYTPYPQLTGQIPAPTPPIHQSYQPPSVQPPPPQPLPQQQQQQPSQEQLLKQVLEMPQEQIDQLPPADRAQIMALRQQLRGY